MVRIRRIGPGDRGGLIALLVESFGEELELSHLTPESVRDQVNAALATSRPPVAWGLRLAGTVAELWVATAGGELVGCYGLSGGDPLTLSTVAVRPDRRRRGLGRMLVEHALGRARELRRRRVVLEVLAENPAAVGLYSAFGFRPYDRRRSYALRARLDGFPPLPAGVRLVPLTRRHLAVWSRVLAVSVPAEALPFADGYRREYVANGPLRRVEEGLPAGRTVRRTLLVGEQPTAFALVRRTGRRPAAEVPPPLYLTEAAPHLPALLGALSALAADGGARHCRLYLSEDRPEGWAAAEGLGYAYERAWLYMWAEV